MRTVFALLAFVVVTPIAPAQPPAPHNAADGLSATLRGLLLANLPDPLYEASPNWGHTAAVKSIRFRGLGLNARPETTVVQKNDGAWRKMRVTPINPKDSLAVELRDVNRHDGKTTFTIVVAGDGRFYVRQQKWESGIKLYDVSAKVRARVTVTLKCEAKSRVELKNGLPDLVVEIHVAEADVKYENLVFEHLPGVGGEAAQIIGTTAHAALGQWKPSLERDLLARARATAAKAVDHREIRIGLGKLFPAPAPAK